MKNNFWSALGKVATEVLTEIGSMAEDKRKAEETINRLKSIEERQKELEQAKQNVLNGNLNEVKFVYSQEELQQKSKYELEQLVYAVYREKDNKRNKTAQDKEIAEEARALYFETTSNEERRRLILIKFLLQHGGI